MDTELDAARAATGRLSGRSAGDPHAESAAALAAMAIARARLLAVTRMAFRIGIDPRAERSTLPASP